MYLQCSKLLAKFTILYANYFVNFGARIRHKKANLKKNTCMNYSWEYIVAHTFSVSKSTQSRYFYNTAKYLKNANYIIICYGSRSSHAFCLSLV